MKRTHERRVLLLFDVQRADVDVAVSHSPQDALEGGHSVFSDGARNEFEFGFRLLVLVDRGGEGGAVRVDRPEAVLRVRDRLAGVCPLTLQCKQVSEIPQQERTSSKSIWILASTCFRLLNCR